MSNKAETLVEKKTWTTWEELLLACAVKRHGLRDWESVAMELQTRTFLPDLLTAQICRNKFNDLKRRFMDSSTTDDHDEETIPWLEELRKLRVAELKQEVHRYDLSIQSLQLKVKRLEEERERSSKENLDDDDKPDLEKDLKEKRSENDRNDGDGVDKSPAGVVGKSFSGEDSDRDDRSFNESNSTENRVKEEAIEPEPIQTGDVEPDRDLKPVEEDSCNDSSDTIAKQEASKPSQEKRVSCDSAELRDSAADSKEGTKGSSDVQSTASLTTKKRRKADVSGGGSGSGADGDEPVVASPAINTKGDSSMKSEPLAALLDTIRSHKHGSVFQHRLDSQKTEKYKKLVRQHVDLQTVQTRIDDGSYSSCPSKFFVDLLLVFNNAIVFFPKSSGESDAAYELRDVVSKELRKKQRTLLIPEQPSSLPESASTMVQAKPDPEKSELLLAKHKVSPPIVACRKRSSISAKSLSISKREGKQADGKLADEKPALNPKPPVSNKSSATPNEEESSVKLKVKEKPVTGVRSMRRTSQSRADSSIIPNKNQISTTSSSAEREETPRAENRKTEVVTTTKKRGAAADFLKRIKKNSPAEGTPPQQQQERLRSLTTTVSESSGGKREQKKKLDDRKDGMVRRSSVGGRQAKEENSPSKRSVGRPPKKGRDTPPGKRGREGGGEAEGASKRPKKRTRR